MVRIATALIRKPNENPLAKSSQDPFMDPEPELTVRVRSCFLAACVYDVSLGRRLGNPPTAPQQV